MRLVAVLVFICAFATGAGAAPKKVPIAPPTLEDYFGDWQGTATAMSETDEDFPTSKRDIAVSIAKTDLSGVHLSWSTLQPTTVFRLRTG